MASLKNIPRNVWVLGFTSLLTDVSSEMIHSVLPLFMVTVLGANVMTIGLIEGIAEATASILKLFSGTISDHWQQRKALVIVGYGLSADACLGVRSGREEKFLPICQNQPRVGLWQLTSRVKTR
jgi:MFS family permease